MSNDTFQAPERGVIFWPVGTGDSTTVVVDEERWVQIDLHHLAAADEDDDPRVAVVDRLVELLPHRDGTTYLAAFAATHLDQDHILGFKALLDHQVQIGELWFSPRVLWDAREAGELCADAQAFVAEVDRRVDANKGGGAESGDRILIVGDDDILSETPYSELPAECFTRPGEFFTTLDGDDFHEIFRVFVHAPFKDDGSAERNDTSLGLQITLADGETTGTLMTLGDLAYPDVKNVFDRSKAEDLLWSVFLAPHHCSKSVMYWQDEGEEEPTLKQPVLDAIENAADDRGAWIVASCDEIPATDEDGANPPHRIAADRYEELVDAGRFLVTGDAAPEPLVFELGDEGLCLRDAPDGGEDRTVPAATAAAGGADVSSHTSAVGFG
jgi:hypothetical protein